MTDTAPKPWYQSATILAGIFMILSGLGLAGINIDWSTGDFHGNFYTLFGSISQALGGVGAVIGRLRANRKIAATIFQARSGG